TTAHPDDEHGGLLAMLSRGQGARVSLLTLTRGESGDNAIGPELFDAVGLIRTEELIQADRYYGVDRQYFTTLVDYGFSKRVEEAFEKWGRDAVLRDVVRVIRMDRPLVLISRFQGTPRDGHGNHQAAGAITIEAFKAAADPAAFPEQVREGLRPWQPLKLYVGGVRESEDWTIAVDTGTYDPVLGDSYQNLSRLGLAYQRSQNSGVARLAPGPAVAYYKRVASLVAAPAKESSFFDGVDVTIPGLYRALRKPAPAGAERLLTRLADEIDSVVKAFSMTDPAESAPGLARALAKARGALAELGGDADVADVLRMKEAQLEDAINAVLGIAFTAVAQPAATQVAGPLTMGPVVPGQTFEVRTSFTVRGSRGVSSVQISLGGEPGWSLQGGAVLPETAETNRPMVATFPLTVPAAAKLSKPCFSRESLQESRYTLCDPKQFGKPSTDPPVTAIASYEVDGVRVEMRVPVSRLEANLPYGNETRALAVVPAIGVSLSPASAIVPLAADSKTIEVRAELVNNRDGASDGVLSLGLPDGWSADPANHPFQFSRAGERAFVTFGVRIRSIDPREYRIDAVARSGGQDYREGYDVLQHRDLETRYLYHPASVIVRGVDVKVAPQLSVGYVMGIGDDVPRAIAQLGADVRLLASADLASADLSRFDAIVIGTRAYAVRDDLKTDNRRLLDYVRGGGHLIVLYNTQELVPRLYAPFPGELPPDAEEVSEEDSPVEILAPRDPVFTTPNRITRTDFDGWVEQRGSKFWRTWDAAYSPMIATHDQGQPPQRGGWLHARYGKGHYTYFAYALHRQLPYGVPGAYRLLANLLSLGKD
ncbi:MAG TPA: PIG-L family deacetylase, partial [Vicinamibacterales bacterium]